MSARFWWRAVNSAWSSTLTVLARSMSLEPAAGGGLASAAGADAGRKLGTEASLGDSGWERQTQARASPTAPRLSPGTDTWEAAKPVTVPHCWRLGLLACRKVRPSRARHAGRSVAGTLAFARGWRPHSMRFVHFVPCLPCVSLFATC